jgi:hypothetical protein
MTLGDLNGDGEFNVGDVTAWAGLSNQNRLIQQQAKANVLLAELVAEQRRIQSLPTCPACKKPVEIDSRLCANCRSSLSWIGNQDLYLPAIKGEERSTWHQWFRMKAQLETARSFETQCEIDDLIRDSKALTISFWLVIALYICVAVLSLSCSEVTLVCLLNLSAFFVLLPVWLGLRRVLRVFVTAEEGRSF